MRPGSIRWAVSSATPGRSGTAASRDDIRRFVKGEDHTVSGLATRLLGSPDIYGHKEREAEHSINFVTCHDGFTLNDLVSYNGKHNEANGDNNTDGANDNNSWNCGAEGPTDDPDIEALRNRQVKNFLTLNLLAAGTPMLLMGDEVRRTQHGNNNAYCQDNEISWFDWTLLERHADIHRFVKLLTAFRQRRDVVTADRPLTLNELLDRARIEWHGVKLNQPDWGEHSHALAFTFASLKARYQIHGMLNAYWSPLTFEVPPPQSSDRGWRRVIDTALTAPDDFTPVGRGAARDIGELRGATTLDGALHTFARAAQSGTSCEAVIHMAIDPRAGQPAPERLLVDVDLLLDAYYTRTPDVEDVTQRVRFGTSGHRGSSLRGTFTEAHVLAITQAICDYRSAHGIGGPLYLGKDTHALSEPAFKTALEVLAANGVEVMIDSDEGYTPTPAISHAILAHNRRRPSRRADGIVITPSHNPPEDGGFKYNPPTGGPADTGITRWIEERANELLADELR